ncbi:glycoside hydrolase family 16 protein [Actinomadura rupiterrae]|uniref:glycoside hydrolase family 16 protein n=1 Tax=Actinomadura rupiterrae TaxID=559627 RepID=UPI0020A448CE|nr:glycoside hydrolase family 16 protein [Actinomadura rupiterrae]MCP2341166.1 hypothetical protein [Actinomadura rupiterrae]
MNPRTAQATTVSGGALHLTGALYGGKDLSGGIASTLLQRYGRWEVRLRADPGRGYSPVALLWPAHFGHPEKAEIDFTEIPDPTRHTADIHIHHGPTDQQATHQLHADFTHWHTIAVDWLPDHLTFWPDGHPTWTYTGPLLPQHTTMGLTLQNDQTCDRGPTACRDHTTPAKVTMDIDWIRIYPAPPTSTNAPLSTPSATPASPTPTPSRPTTCPAPPPRQ